jgi:hypothetical protein
MSKQKQSQNIHPPDYLLPAHSLGSGSDVVHMLGEVLPGQLIYGRDMVKHSADDFQLHRMWMVNARRGKRHLFLILFAHFSMAHFFVLRIIPVDFTSFITTQRRDCPL